MIETLYRVRCDKCGTTTGAHVSAYHQIAVENLEAKGWHHWSKFGFELHMCPKCDKENIYSLTNDEIVQVKGKVECADCGEQILLCSECLARRCKDEPECFEFWPVDQEDRNERD